MKLNVKSLAHAVTAAAVASSSPAFAHIPSVHIGMTTEEVNAAFGKPSSQECTRTLGVATCHFQWKALFGSGACTATTIFGRVVKWSCSSACN